MSYTFTQTGSEIQAILDRAEAGGQIDQDIAAKQDQLTFDAVPTEGSTNPAESGGIYDAIQAGGATALAAFATDTVSGDVVSFPDGASNIPVKSFTGSIVPIQDLHGQSAPYPAGGGKNKLQITATTQTINGVTITVNADGSIKVNGTTTAQTILPISDLLTPLATGNPVILNGCPSGGSTSTYCLDTGSNAYVDSGSGVTLGDAQLSGQRVRLRLANGQTFNNMMFYPMIRLATVTDATFAPYSNICPISGWAGAEIWRSARNLVCGRISGYTINASGILSPAQGGTYDIVYAKVEQGEQYIVTSGAGLVGGFFREIPVASAQSYNQSRLDTGTMTVTAPISGWLAFRVATGYATPQVEVGSTATAYDDTLDTILLDFGTTVYAGTLTALGGGLWSVQPTHEIVDLGDYEYTLNANFGFRATVADGITPVAGGDAGSICSAYKRISFPTVADPSLMANGDFTIAEANISPVINYVYFKNSAYSTAAAFKTAMAGQKLVYTLAPASRPDPIIVSAEDLQTLLGSNSIWTDVGSITGMTYRADTALYIQKLLNGGGTLQTLSMASPSPSLSLGRVGVLAEQEASESEQTEEAEQLEQTEETEQAEEE